MTLKEQTWTAYLISLKNKLIITRQKIRTMSPVCCQLGRDNGHGEGVGREWGGEGEGGMLGLTDQARCHHELIDLIL
jgi:hypothetical protein